MEMHVPAVSRVQALRPRCTCSPVHTLHCCLHGQMTSVDADWGLPVEGGASGAVADLRALRRPSRCVLRECWEL